MSNLLVVKALKSAELKKQKQEQIIDAMSPEQVLNELKQKRLPTYGTAQERRDRLKKQFGIATVPVVKAKSSLSVVQPGGTFNKSKELDMMTSPMGEPKKQKTTM